MTQKRKTFAWITGGVIVLCAAAITFRVIITRLNSRMEHVTIVGAVLRRDRDPRKQAPIAQAIVTAIAETSGANTKSDSSGLFHLTLRDGVKREQPITLRFEHAEYKPFEMTAVPRDQLYIIRMEPLVQEKSLKTDQLSAPAKPVMIKDVRVQYSVQDQTTRTVGSVARQFDVINTGNVPCKGHPPCSPDGKWKAATGSLTLDALKGNEFHNLRVSCIAGPCPFTRIQPENLSHPARMVTISVLNWSDTTSFLVEAEVIRTMATELVRISYPFIIGETMSFALPAAAEGPSIQADLNGDEIVFPLGPKLILSWATCSVEIPPGNNKIYRCELKPGYEFQPEL
jgi:hypothetical protein